MNSNPPPGTAPPSAPVEPPAETLPPAAAHGRLLIALPWTAAAAVVLPAGLWLSGGSPLAVAAATLVGLAALLALAGCGWVAARQHWRLTERALVRSQEKLEDVKSRLEDFTELGSDWIWEQDPEYRSIMMSGGAFDRVGLQRGVYIGKRRWETPSYGISAEAWEEHRHTVYSHRPFRNLIYQRPDSTGALRWVLINGKPVFGPNGEFRGYRGTGRDISAQKDAELQRQVERDAMRLLTGVATASNVLGEVAKSYALAFDWDFCAVWSLQRGTWTAHEEWARGAVVPAQPPALLESGFGGSSPLWRTLAGNATEAASPGTWMVAPFGPDNERYAVVFWRKLAIPASAEHLDWLQTIAHRLTEFLRRRATERELAASLRRFQTLLDNSLVGISMTIDRHFVWVNDRYVTLFGRPREDFIGHSTRWTFPSDEAFDAFGARCYPLFSSGRGVTVEAEYRRADGSPLWAEVHGMALNPDNLAEGIIWTLVDITARKQAEWEIRAALSQQQELNVLKSKFVAMTSHEFRTPLATILSSSELLRDYFDHLDATTRVELLGQIIRAVNRMTDMLDKVLLIGRADAGRLEFHPTPVDLATLTDEVTAEVERTFAHLPPPVAVIKPSFQSSAGLPSLDEKLVRQILINLLANALKYSPQGGIVDFTTEVDNGEVRFTVTDQGIGIPPDDLDKLFTTFHRAANVGTIAGTGLGLAIVKKAVDLHGGSVRVQSEVGKGTSFQVWLPAR